MKRKYIQPDAYASLILSELPKGILLNTAADGVMDTMTIGWGFMGTDWGRPVFTVLVRESRYTKELLDANPEFTLSIPLEGMDVRKIISFCGTKSGRDINKFEACALDCVKGEKVSSCAIAQLPLTLECKVLYRQDQDPAQIPCNLLKSYYPQQDYHTAYIGEIVNAYILEEDAD